MERWTSAYRFEWSPILSFASRRQSFLEWVDENADPLAFRDADHELGLEFIASGLRLLIRRDGMTIENGAVCEDPVGDLRPMLDGVLDVLAPKDVRLSVAALAFSAPLGDVNYDAARGALARGLVGDDSTEPFDITDASCLVDVIGEGFHAQAEWGVVQPGELISILSHDQGARLGSIRPPINREAPTPAVDSLTAANLFVDVLVRVSEPSIIHDATGIASTTRDVDSIAVGIANVIAQRKFWEEGSK